MLHKYILIGLLAVCGYVHAELSLFDQETPYTPLKEEHALFYSAVWTAIGGSLGYGIYLLAKTVKKPVDSNAIMNDAICALTITIFAKMLHHSVNEVVEALQFYFKKSEQSQA